MISREMLIPPPLASMFILLVFDYSLPLNVYCGPSIVLEQTEHRRRSVLRKITVEYEESNEDYLEAALVILNLN